MPPLKSSAFEAMELGATDRLASNRWLIASKLTNPLSTFTYMVRQTLPIELQQSKLNSPSLLPEGNELGPAGMQTLASALEANATITTINLECM